MLQAIDQHLRHGDAFVDRTAGIVGVQR